MSVPRGAVTTPTPGPPPASYPEALAALYPRTTQIKFGLETTRALLTAAGEPQSRFAAIHIGGTNGKGSVATLVAAALQRAGHRVGLYTSPHLQSFRERIRVDGVPISEAAVLAWTRHLWPTIAATNATFFEITTAMALADFAARGVTVAVVEVGLGGRLDSTNALHPLVSAVTHVALDHQQYLGDTIAAIAREKAGIAKPGVPFVIGEADPGVAALLHEAGRTAVGEGLYRPITVPPAARWEGPLGLTGAHQRRNAAVAATVLSTLPAGLVPPADIVAEAFADTTLPGRIDRRGRWLYDVAHNPDGMAALVAALRADPPPAPLHALVAILGDKDWQGMLEQLRPIVDVGVLTTAPSAGERRWDQAAVAAWVQQAPDRWRVIPRLSEALAAVERGAGTILVTGSFHTVGDVMTAQGLGID